MKVGIMGAGAIGCYVGGRLIQAGADVVLIGRESLRQAIAKDGLTVADSKGAAHLAPERVRVSTSPSALADCEATLVCVKSADSEGTARSLAEILPQGALVVSLQNGVRNAEAMREHAPGLLVAGGVVGFNVVTAPGAIFRRTTAGDLAVEDVGDARVLSLAMLLRQSGLRVTLARDIRARQWAKLVVNLNNAISALSGAPTRELLFSTGYRTIVASVVREALDVLEAAGVASPRLGRIPLRIVPSVLTLPAPLVRGAIRVAWKVDAEARSSMWEDLERRRPTEVDYLNGEVVRLAAASATRAPLNRRLVDLVHEVERRGQGSPNFTESDLARELDAT